MRSYAPGGALVSNVEVTATTVQRGDIIQLGGHAFRVRPLPTSPGSEATGLRVGRAADLTCAYPTRRRANAEKAVTRSMRSRHHEIADDLRHQITGAASCRANAFHPRLPSPTDTGSAR